MNMVKTYALVHLLLFSCVCAAKGVAYGARQEISHLLREARVERFREPWELGARGDMM